MSTIQFQETKGSASEPLNRTFAARPVPRSPDRPLFPCQGLSISRITVYTCATVCFLFTNMLGLAGNAIFFAAVAVLLVSSPSLALMGFSCAVLALTANIAFVPKSIVFTFSRVLSVAIFSARFALTGDAAWVRSPPYIALTIFCVVAAMCSIMSGYFTHIALMKVLIFWSGMTGFFSFIATIRRRKLDTTEWFVAQAAAVCVLNALALLLGVAQNFKGENVSHGLYNLGLYHSQTTGPISALLMIYLTCVVLFAGHRNRWICWPLLGFLAYCLLLTQSRTGAATLTISLSIVAFLALLFNSGRRSAIRLNYSRTLIGFCIAAVVIGGILFDLGSQGALTTRARSFLIKSRRDSESVSIDRILSSRAALMEQSLQNFRASPIVGIGFGVSTNPNFQQTATVLYAPVEKGFLPTAILEEVGLLGTAAFIGFVLTMFVSLARARNIPGLAMFAALLILNLGEAGIFALGGHSAFMWLFVVGGILLGDRCTTQLRLRHGNTGQIGHDSQPLFFQAQPTQ